jgi:hypothetical protein
MNSVERMCRGCHRGDCPDCAVRRSELQAWGKVKRRAFAAGICVVLCAVLAHFGPAWAWWPLVAYALGAKVQPQTLWNVARALGGDADTKPPSDEE